MTAASIVRGTSSGASNGTITGVSFAVTPPAGVVANDQLILQIVTRDAMTGWRPGAGWLLIDRPAESSGEGFFYRAKYGTDVTGTSWTFDNGAGNATATKWEWSMVALKGDQVGNYLTGAAQVQAASNTALATPTIAPAAQCHLVAAAGIRITGTIGFTWPAGWVEQTDVQADAGATNNVTGSIAVFDTTPTAAGSYSVTATSSAASAIGWAGIFAFANASVTPVAPVADFTATPVTGTSPLTVQFTDASSGVPTSWSWTFGDGTTSTAQNPSKTYSTPGTYTVALAATNAQGSNTNTKTGYITVTTPPVSGPLTTQELLARTTKAAPTGVFTTEYTDAAPAADKTYDLRGAEFQGYFDADAIYGFGTFSNGSGGTNATPHQLNKSPINIGESGTATRAAIIGGKVIGDQPTTLTWNRMKHGSHIQAALDAGQTGDEAWALIVNNQNQDGDPRIKVASGSWAVVDGLRCYNTHDGLGIYSQTDSLTDTGNVYVRNMWVRFNHDDAIENDRAYLTLDVNDSLFEDIHGLLSVSGVTGGTPDATKTQTIRNSIISFKAKPGPYQKPTSVLAHGGVFKDTTNSPPLVMQNCIIAAEKFTSSGAAQLPTTTGSSYTNVTIVWLGSGAYPGNVPTGCTLTTDRTILDNAIADWKYRHGVTDFDTVDSSLMISPRASAPAPGAQGPLPGLIDGVEPEAQSHVPPFCDGNGNLYRVTEEYLAGGNNPQMLKSTDGGSTWNIVDAAGQMAGSSFNDMEAAWCLQVGTAIVLLFSDSDSLFYLTFNTSDAPTNPDTWQVKENGFAFGTSSGSRCHVSAVRLSDGRLRAFFLEGPSGSNQQTYYATKTNALAAGGWSAKTALQPTTSSFIGVMPVVGAADLVHMFFHDYANKQIRYCNLSSAGVLSTSVRADTTGTNTNSLNYHAASNAVYYEAAGSWTAAALYASSAGVRLVSVVNGVVQAEQLLDSNAPLISPVNTDGNTGSDGAVIHLAVEGTTLHAIWTEAASGDLFYASRPHGGSWSTRTVLWDAPSGRAAFWVYSNVYTRNGSLVMGYTYDDGPHPDDDSNIYYNEKILTPAVVAVGRLIDKWNGTALVRQRVDKWNGTALVQQIIDV